VDKKSLGFSRVDKQIDRTKIPNPCHKKNCYRNIIIEKREF